MELRGVHTVTEYRMSVSKGELVMLREGLAYILNASGYAEEDKNIASEMFNKFCEAESNA